MVIFHAWAGIYSYYLELEIKLRPPPEYQLENLAFEKEMEQPEQYTPIPGEVITKDSSLNEHVPVSV
ncbi:hypothetical protein C0J52_00189 [Blattella germanica]|nr:hypothetical protein C0J52_00189 [Blattella germanica]